jgi:hypothetical protein
LATLVLLGRHISSTFFEPRLKLHVDGNNISGVISSKEKESHPTMHNNVTSFSIALPPRRIFGIIYEIRRKVYQLQAFFGYGHPIKVVSVISGVIEITFIFIFYYILKIFLSLKYIFYIFNFL